MRTVNHVGEYLPKHWEGVGELSIVSVFLAIILCAAPLGSRLFLTVVYAACALTALYVSLRLLRTPGISRRWGLFSVGHDPINSLQRLEGDGCAVVGWLLLLSLAPMMLLRLFVPMPSLPPAASYLLWCAVQDFVFFALIQRNLEDRLSVGAAVCITALLFGLSHYPYQQFMAITFLVGLVWGHLYAETRSLTLLILTHWLMGLITLS